MSNKSEVKYCLSGVVSWVFISMLIMYGFHWVYYEHLLNNEGNGVKSIVIILTITLTCGIWGGIGGYSLIYLNRKHYELSSLDEKSNDGIFTDEINLVDEINPYIFLGVISSNLVPLFLGLLSQGSINVFVDSDNTGEPLNHIVDMKWIESFSLIGLCLIAAIYSKNFIVKIGNKTIFEKMKELNSSQSKIIVENKKIESEIEGFQRKNNELEGKLSRAEKELESARERSLIDKRYVAHLNAYHLFKRYLDLKGGGDLSCDVKDDLPPSTKSKMKSYLLKAIDILDSTYFDPTNVDTYILKGNCYRQLSIVTRDESYLVRAYECLDELLKSINDGDFEIDNSDFVCIYVNIICYAINLNKDKNEIIKLTNDAISIIGDEESIKVIFKDNEIKEYLDRTVAYNAAFSRYTKPSRL
ncbi:YEATS-associated helix-containing protein [Photobacterium sp. TY1-4]|uniref:YEATS-associated helix-containing protein n=1 Tax=Photobacterium sp. TY1-4 TaxID=2899122 RepID=UPI0021BF067D|nr:YEATS-associated helix-containing protein [Photobacterium sp. TY1-4]UXI04658.1 hypothetical protein NH461_25420 [Photobacterium sp. TY1-4]